MPVAREGFKFILPSLVLTLLFIKLHLIFVAVFFFLLTAAFLFFFRDPERKPPSGENLLLSPADGKVLSIESNLNHQEFNQPVTKVVIFLSLFNVHVVRSPIQARIGRLTTYPGLFLPAYRSEASTANLSRTVVFTEGITELVLKLIVGVAARRIKIFVSEDECVIRGQRLGLMYFGSRAEIFFPQTIKIRVAVGEQVRAGETIIGEVLS